MWHPDSVNWQPHTKRCQCLLSRFRQFGCETVELAEMLSQIDSLEGLEPGSWQIYSRKLIEAMADEQPLLRASLMSALDSKARSAIEDFFETLFGHPSDLKLLHKLVKTMRATASLGDASLLDVEVRSSRAICRAEFVRLVASE